MTATQVMLDAIGTAMEPGKAALVIASHNESSNAMGRGKAWKIVGWKPGQAPVWFAQLYGMSDHLSFNLAAAHHPVVKYLPFGPVKKSDALPFFDGQKKTPASRAKQAVSCS